jgi:L-2,4-diaminobutyric acid acetyltransferase
MVISIIGWILALGDKRMNFIIKKTDENDFLRVYKFVSKCKPLENYSEHFYKIMLRYFSNSCFIAEFNNEIVGFVMGFRSQVDINKFFLWQIGIFSKYREKEVGKKLLDNVEEAAKKLDCNYVELTVDPENIPSYRFFVKNGYINVSPKEGEIIEVMGHSAVKDYYKPGRHFILFQKELTQYRN